LNIIVKTSSGICCCFFTNRNWKKILKLRTGTRTLNTRWPGVNTLLKEKATIFENTRLHDAWQSKLNWRERTATFHYRYANLWLETRHCLAPPSFSFSFIFSFLSHQVFKDNKLKAENEGNIIESSDLYTTIFFFRLEGNAIRKVWKKDTLVFQLKNARAIRKFFSRVHMPDSP
jgi:hypothetical protein